MPGNSVHEAPPPTRQEAEAEREGGGRRRRRRGGRGRRREGGAGGGGGKQQPRTPIEGLPNDDELDAESEALERSLRGETGDAGEEVAPAPKQSGRASASASRQPPKPLADVEKTGSKDTHLADDEPADLEPVRRPQSYADLDELPDYDD